MSAMPLDPQMLEAILGMGSMDPRQQQVMRQQKMIDQLRQRSMEDPGQQMGGRVVAPNFGSVAQGVVSGMRANRMQPGVDQQAAELNQKQIGAKRQYLDALIGALRRPTPTVQQPTPQQVSSPGTVGGEY